MDEDDSQDIVQEDTSDKVQETAPLEVRVVNKTVPPTTVYDSELEEMYDDLKAQDAEVIKEDLKDG